MDKRADIWAFGCVLYEMLIAYVADNQLYLKNADEFPARPIQGTDEDPLCPFFLPDGQWIGYFCRADRQLKKIAVTGGVSVWNAHPQLAKDGKP